MSLIEEALRRIHDPMVKGVSAPPKNLKNGSIEIEEAKAAHSWSTTPPSSSPLPKQVSPRNTQVILLVIMLTAVLSSAGVLIFGWAFGLKQKSTPRSNEIGTKNAASNIPIPNGQTTKPAANNNGFNLTGVVEGLGEPYAVINGLIVRPGEQVGGATVIGIANGFVTLRRADAAEITLNVHAN